MQKHNKNNIEAENLSSQSQNALLEGKNKLNRVGWRNQHYLLPRKSSALWALGAVLMLSPELQAACTPTPSCAALGYTSTTCSDGGVKCPWDTSKMFCKGGSSSIACQSLSMAVGDILYSDKTYCNPDVHNALITAGQAVKTPIGIISYMSGSKRIAIQLSNPGTMLWSSDRVDIPGITNYNSSPHTTDFNGKANTAAWVSYYGSTGGYAPGYCNNYTTAGATKGDWYLPAQGELYASIWSNKTAVNNGLKKAPGGAVLVENYHWSSSECNNIYAWIVSTGGNTTYTSKYYSLYVRCVLAF